MLPEIKISYSLYKKYSDLLQMKEKQRANLIKERTTLLLKKPDDKDEQIMLNRDLYIVDGKITYKAGEIEMLKKFLNEIIAENKEGAV